MEHYHGGNIRAAIRKYNLKEDSIIDFSANINFLGPPPGVLDKIKAYLPRIVHYPEPNAGSLKEIIAGKFGLARDKIIIGNGAVDLIYQFVKVLKPARVLILEPAFSEYELAVRSMGGLVEHFNLTRDGNFKVAVAELKRKLGRVELLFICNPNNPTGVLLERTEIIDLLNYALKQGVFLLVDEAFIDFVEQPADYTVIDQVKQYSNLFVLRSLTKFYAIPGLRLGYGVVDEKLVRAMEFARDPWSINYLAQLAGELVFGDENYYNLSREKIKQERDYLYQELRKIKDIKVYKPTANYIFIDIARSKYNSGQLTELLAQEGLLIRDCQSYHGLEKDFIRIAVRSRKDNLVLLKKLRELLDL